MTTIIISDNDIVMNYRNNSGFSFLCIQMILAEVLPNPMSAFTRSILLGQTKTHPKSVCESLELDGNLNGNILPVSAKRVKNYRAQSFPF